MAHLHIDMQKANFHGTIKGLVAVRCIFLPFCLKTTLESVKYSNHGYLNC